MLWHFHKEMDVVGSIRQQSDIYIRKNGCCWAEEGKGKRLERCRGAAVIAPSSLMLLDSHFAPPAVVQRWYMKYFLYTICNSSQQRKRGDDTCQRAATGTGGRLMNRFK